METRNELAVTTLAPKKEYVLPDVSRLLFDEKKHAYTLDGKLLSGVTSVIDGTSSKQNLIGWAANMAVDHVKNEIEAWELDSFPVEVIKKLLEEARTAYARKRDKAGQKGTDTHGLVESWINETLEWDARRHKGAWNKNAFLEHAPATLDYSSIKPFIDWAIGNVDYFLAAEQRLFSETHAFAGTCDFVAIIDGKLTIGDLKTFPKMWSADAFIQMGAYSVAFAELTGQRPEQSVVVKMCDPNDERIKKYGGKPFAVYPRYALAEDEEMFLTRLKMYRYNQAFVSPKE